MKLTPVEGIPEEDPVIVQHEFDHRQELGEPAPSIYCEVCHDSGHMTVDHPWRSDWLMMSVSRYELWERVPSADPQIIVVERYDEEDWDSPDVCGECYKPSSMIHLDHSFEEMMVPETIPGWKVYDEDDPAETTTYFRGFDQALREGERLMANVLDMA